MGFLSVLLFCLTLSFNFWGPKALQFYISHHSDFKLSIGTSDCSPWKGWFYFRDIRVENLGKQFSQKKCLLMHDLSVQVNMQSLIKPMVEIEKIAINVTNITCEKGEAGDISIVKFAEMFIPKDENRALELMKNSENIDDDAIRKLSPFRKKKESSHSCG
jgi:hypothetical protein